MNNGKSAKLIGVIWVAAGLSIGVLAVVLQRPERHVSFEHPHRQVASYEPVAVDLSTAGYVAPAASSEPVPEPPVVMKGAKIIIDQASPEPQVVAHSQAAAERLP